MCCWLDYVIGWFLVGIGLLAELLSSRLKQGSLSRRRAMIAIFSVAIVTGTSFGFLAYVVSNEKTAMGNLGYYVAEISIVSVNLENKSSFGNIQL